MCDAPNPAGASWSSDDTIVLSVQDGDLLSVPATEGAPTILDTGSLSSIHSPFRLEEAGPLLFVSWGGLPHFFSSSIEESYAHGELIPDLLCKVYCYTITVRLKFDAKKSAELKANPKRGIGFEETVSLWERPYYLDQRIDSPEQFRAIGWVEDKLYSVIFEVREDEDGEFYHLVTLWKATREERELYEENA